MTSTRLTLGQYLSQARQANVLSIRQLAEMAGLQKTTVERLLEDRVQQPRPSHLLSLARVLELSSSDLFLLAGRPKPVALPTVEALLRAEYDLPESAVAEAKSHIDAIVRRYQSKDHPNPKRKEGT